MKKILLLLSIFGLGLAGAGIAGAQYYNSNYYSTTYVPSTSYQYSYGLAIGSYTIGCTTFYYNTTTGANVGSQNICTHQTAPVTYTTPTTYPVTYTAPATTVYTPPVRPPVVYPNPSYTSYADYYSYPSTQYCTWGYYGGQWHQCAGGGTSYGGGHGYNYGYQDDYQNFLNCYYDEYGQYICW